MVVAIEVASSRSSLAEGCGAEGRGVEDGVMRQAHL
jgi:hypothetical protein